MYILQNGGFAVTRPKDFVAAFHQLRVDSKSIIHTLTRQINLYQFVYIPHAGVSRHDMWESNTDGEIGGFLCHCQLSLQQQLDAWVQLSSWCACTHAVYSDPRGLFTANASFMALSGIRPSRVKHALRVHNYAACNRRGTEQYCPICSAGKGTRAPLSDIADVVAGGIKAGTTGATNSGYKQFSLNGRLGHGEKRARSGVLSLEASDGAVISKRPLCRTFLLAGHAAHVSTSSTVSHMVELTHRSTTGELYFGVGFIGSSACEASLEPHANVASQAVADITEYDSNCASKNLSGPVPAFVLTHRRRRALP